ncbi:MAG: calcium/sodium antiporter [Flavobacteriaceae bacterium]
MYLRNATMDAFKIIIGLSMLILGGEWLLRSAVALSYRLRVPKIVVGMTVVSLATSLPELIVSVQSAVQGYPDLALANVVGSNVANLGLVLGMVLLFSRIHVTPSFYRADWPLMFIATVLLWLFIRDGNLSALEGLFLLLGLMMMLGYLFNYQKQAVLTTEELKENHPAWVRIVFFGVVGGALLAFGSDFLVDGAVGLARELGVSERIIGITLVSVGTSIPELAASLIAIYRKENAISLGNLLGSNMFNILVVLGVTALIHPLEVYDTQLLNFDIYIVLAIAALILPLVFIPKRMQLGWQEGLVLLVCYCLFILKTIA